MLTFVAALTAAAGNMISIGAAEPGPANGVLRGTIVSEETGLPTPCTVAITDAAGRLIVDSEGYRGGFRCDGRFVKNLSPGRTRIRVTRGFETRAQEREVALPAGGEIEVNFRLARVVDLRPRGWFAGDSHVHMIHGERTIPVDFDQVALAAKAEDLQYLSLAPAWQIDQPSPENLERELSRRSSPDCVLTWNLEAPKNYYRGDAGRCLGHCWTLGMRGRTVQGADVIELLAQASAHDYEAEKPTYANFESHHLIRAQGGTVFYSHPARWWMGPWGGKGPYPARAQMRVSNLAVELPLDTLVGPTFDGLDILTGVGEHKANAIAFQIWCLLLNQGYRVAATASSDACFDRHGGAVPGGVRTYTHLEGQFSLAAAARATAKGRTFVTSGPLLLVTLDGQPPGSSLASGDRAHTLAIQAWASGADEKGLTRMEVLRNGHPFQAFSFSPPRPAISTNLPLRESGSAWFCVRLFGGDPMRQQAISGAFFLDARPFQPPAPVRARVAVSLVDAASGKGVSGKVIEVEYQATLPREGTTHAIKDGQASLVVPATVRLRAEAPGYQPMTLSPVLDHPDLVQAICRLTAEDLAKVETFELFRRLLGEVSLVFRLVRTSG